MELALFALAATLEQALDDQEKPALGRQPGTNQPRRIVVRLVLGQEYDDGESCFSIFTEVTAADQHLGQGNTMALLVDNIGHSRDTGEARPDEGDVSIDLPLRLRGLRKTLPAERMHDQRSP
ncbi:hypothetical protein PHYPSEUDO_007643 [Phytophthora pseudosyringae]|uniref:Uncharacterized protein n=1 Tax=Phytophthora pseudosyringae TaxID=221518 RepID=A0A8T1VJ24_9STRA|nr:hypothetical protein PHYPSEUDO_007643 [Phytophthora pseudosyringae]